MDQKVPEKRQRISTLGQIGLQQFAPYLMNRIMGRYNATLRDDLRKQGLTIPQVRALAVLSVMRRRHRQRPLGLHRHRAVDDEPHARRAGGARPGAARAGRDRQPRPQGVPDRRGRAEFGRAWPAMHDAFEAMFDGIDDAEYAALIATLHKMLSNIRKHDI